jgi:hypothetical protein
VNENNMSNVRGEASRYFTNKKREYWKPKLMSINQTAGKNIRDLYN